jgi:hypothetical protein
MYKVKSFTTIVVSLAASQFGGSVESRLLFFNIVVNLYYLSVFRSSFRLFPLNLTASRMMGGN